MKIIKMDILKKCKLNKVSSDLHFKIKCELNNTSFDLLFLKKI